MWKVCSVCKKKIPLGGIYHKCTVSSCRKSSFCSVECWDVHNGILNHKSAWAEEAVAPTSVESTRPDGPRRIIVSSKQSTPKNDIPREVLIVASKLKKYVKDKHGMNTSGDVMDKLSELVRFACDDAVEKARIDGRKTLMGRDF